MKRLEGGMQKGTTHQTIYLLTFDEITDLIRRHIEEQEKHALKMPLNININPEQKMFEVTEGVRIVKIDGPLQMSGGGNLN
jgi:hypothetical protein